jgi:hypothetical protein
MRRDDLVCANCAGRVSEGRCAVCRMSREQYGRGPQGFYTALWIILALAAALVCGIALEARFA